MKKKTKSKNIELFGFSGGAAVTVLVASKRDDVKKIVTIAGNLNHKLHSRIHKVSLLNGSLNPIDYALKISSIKQIHFVGKEDRVVPLVVVKSFVEKSNSNNVELKVIEEAGHIKVWEQKWSQLLFNKI